MFKRWAIIHSLVPSRELHFWWIYSEGSGLHKGKGLLCLSRRSSSIGELSPLSFLSNIWDKHSFLFSYKRRLTKAFEALWLALVTLFSGKSRYPEVMLWVKIITNNVHSFKGMSDKKNSFGNQMWFSLIRAQCEWSSRFKWLSLVDVSATTGLTIWQWKGIGRTWLVIKIEMRGMFSDLVDWKRLPKVVVAALSALSWFVLRISFFLQHSNIPFSNCWIQLGISIGGFSNWLSLTHVCLLR